MAKLLIIDDDEILRSTMARALRRQGYGVEEAANGVTGVESARANLPDLILSDIKMARMDGYMALDQLRGYAETASIPIILMTGHANPGGMRRGMEMGADDYLAKPFTVEALVAAVEARLKKRELFRQQAEQTRARLVSILEATTDLVVISDAAFRQVHYMNRAGRVMLGLEGVADWSGADLRDLFGPDHRERLEKEAIPAAVENGAWSGEGELLSRAGGRISVSQVLLCQRSAEGAVEYLALLARDITDRKVAEESVRESREQMRALAERVLAAREEERKVISRAVHDELGQALTGLKMDLAWLGRRLSAPHLDELNRESVTEKIRAMSGHIDVTIQQVRKISTELRPGVLDDLGLGAAIEWQANEFRQRMGIECEVVLEELNEGEVSPAKATAVFRILQELLTNVVRHAEATRVVIELGVEEGWLCLTVRDNGRGIRNNEVEAAESLGILGMRERAAVFGGSVEFDGRASAGTTVTMRIPFKTEP